MLTFLTGFGFGAAAGWFTYVHREWLFMLLLINGGAAIQIIFLTLILPSSSAAGAMDMTLWQFAIFAVDQISNDYLIRLLGWFNMSFLMAHIATWVAYKGFEPQPERGITESRNDRRKRIEADMNYRDSYFD